MKVFIAKLLSLVFVVASCSTAISADLKTSALSTLQKVQKAIVTVRVQALIKTRGQEQEQKVEVTGTMIDPSGLTVVSEQSIDPAAMLTSFMSSYSRKELPDFKFETQITETAIILDDGTEIPADVVLKDADLDFAFIKPKEVSDKFVHIPMKAREKPIELLDDFFVIGRLGRSENRAIHLNTGMVLSIVKGPRTFYVCDQEVAANSIGCPAFSSDGLPIGLFVSRRNQGGGEDNSMNAFMSLMMGRIGQSGSIWILRSVVDVLEVSAQALNPNKD